MDRPADVPMPATQKDARALSGRRMWRVRLTKIKLQYQEKNVGRAGRNLKTRATVRLLDFV
jgi:hypothetical protein